MEQYRLKAFTIQIPDGESRTTLVNNVSGKKVSVTLPLLERLLKDGSAASDPEKFVLTNFLVRTGEYEEEKKRTTLEKFSKAIERTDVLSLYAVTTRECNFRCPYCSMEDNLHASGGYMKTEVLRGLSRWITRRAERHRYGAVHINLYGGEPFFEPAALMGMMGEIRSGVSMPVDFFAATNGYNLRKEDVPRLKELGLRQVMITLDGPPEIHNKRRILAGGGEGTFQRLLDNIKACCDELRTCVRINIDSQNIGHVEKLFTLLKEEGLAGKVTVDAYPVEPGCSDNEHCGSFALNGESLNALASAWETIAGKGFTMAKRIPFASPCAYYGKHALTIDLNGDVYPCPGMIGYAQHVCGSVLRDGLAEKSVSQTWEKCVGCENIFSCAGGCRAISMAEHGDTDHLICRKKNLGGALERYYTLLHRHGAGIPAAGRTGGLK